MVSHINKDAPFYDYVITKTKKTTVKRKKITITHTPKDNNIDRNNKSITRTKTTQTTTKTETLVKQTLKIIINKTKNNSTYKTNNKNSETLKQRKQKQ